MLIWEHGLIRVLGVGTDPIELEVEHFRPDGSQKLDVPSKATHTLGGC